MLTCFTNTGCPVQVDGDVRTVGARVTITPPPGFMLEAEIIHVKDTHATAHTPDPLVPEPIRLYFDVTDCPDRSPRDLRKSDGQRWTP